MIFRLDSNSKIIQGQNPTQVLFGGQGLQSDNSYCFEQFPALLSQGIHYGSQINALGCTKEETNLDVKRTCYPTILSSVIEGFCTCSYSTENSENFYQINTGMSYKPQYFESAQNSLSTCGFQMDAPNFSTRCGQSRRQPLYKDHFKIKYTLNQQTKRQNIIYICKFPGCDREFLKKWNFTEHFKSHSHEKPFQCTGCGKCFSQKGSLLKHMMLMNNDGLHSYSPEQLGTDQLGGSKSFFEYKNLGCSQ